MKNKWSLIGSVVQLIFGILAIIAFVVLLITGEKISQWIVTLLFAIAFVIMGILGIIDYKSQK